MFEQAFSPIRIGGITVPNRIFRPAHTANNTPGGRVGERFIAAHEEAARGGVGLSITGGAAIHWSSMLHPNGLAVWDDASVPGLQQFAERMAPYPMKAIVQLWHGGHNGFTANGSPPWSASTTPGVMVGVQAIAMSTAQINEIVAAYRDAAVRVAHAGLDGCEVHAGHGYLLRQFLATAINHREDDYGGTLANRARFLLEVLRAIRAAVPKGFVVGVRMGPETRPGLVELDEMMQVVAMIEADGLVDYLNLTVGEYSAPEMMAAPMHEPSGYQLPYNGDVKSQVTLPVLVTGRFRTVEEVDQAVRLGQADLVGMVRAHLADPHIVRKTRENRVDEIRPCIACNQRCIGGLFLPPGEPFCAVNPRANLESTVPEPTQADTPRTVMVIGGGVAGMEAARVAALRGHRVTLFEARPQLGGTVRFAARHAPKMASFGDITFWQEAELRRLGVEVQTGQYVDADDVRRAAPDAVVIATGARARLDGGQRHRPGLHIEGLAQRTVLSSEDVLSLPREQLGDSAVVLDDVGHYEGIAVAEYLIQRGLHVSYVTRHAAFAPLMDACFRAGPAYARLHRTGRFTAYTRATLARVEARSATLFDPAQDAAPQTVPADTLVLVGFNQPNSELRDALGDDVAAVHSIGDALSPRFIEAAIAEGYHTGLAL
ncbi:FAD-dependent oxidoreductase [Polycyclovorans algicola]|uniref:FAD-dependent oxidoreductase n=1 Tax=Polycyclovorans algicola TaxID=616992 RepID=UPI0004A7660A|nr:FAD-dependent oxidoreductase [Polycyclovorans algicola]